MKMFVHVSAAAMLRVFDRMRWLPGMVRPGGSVTFCIVVTTPVGTLVVDAVMLALASSTQYTFTPSSTMISTCRLATATAAVNVADNDTKCHRSAPGTVMDQSAPAAGVVTCCDCKKPGPSTDDTLRPNGQPVGTVPVR